MTFLHWGYSSGSKVCVHMWASQLHKPLWPLDYQTWTTHSERACMNEEECQLQNCNWRLYALGISSQSVDSIIHKRKSFGEGVVIMYVNVVCMLKYVKRCLDRIVCHIPTSMYYNWSSTCWKWSHSGSPPLIEGIKFHKWKWMPALYIDHLCYTNREMWPIYVCQVQIKTP